jgi:CheY-like chemotaxis protein
MDILVIDDNELMQHVLCRFIKKIGHTAESVATLAEAHQRAAAHPFEMLLVDMRLPDAEGPEALEELRQIPGYASVTAIAISGDSQPPEHEIAQAGFAGYLTKPIEFTELQACIKRATENG